MEAKQCKQALSRIFNKELRSLNESELVPLDDPYTVRNNVKDAIFEKIDDGSIKIVFRGDKQTNVCNKIFNSPNEVDDFKLFSHLYYFGGKADHFFSTNDDKEDENSRSILDNYGEDAARFLFREFNKIVIGEDLDEEQKRELIKQRYKNNEFNLFFSKKENRKEFEEEICSLDLGDRREIFDYYFYILHVFGKKGISKFTGFVSTSYLYSTAKAFAERKKYPGSGPFIYIYAVDMPVIINGICSNSISYFDKFDKFKNLKRVKKVFFAEEKELAIKRALFPHHIIGIENIFDNSIIVNPYFITNDKITIKNQLENGIIVPNANIQKDAKEFRYRKITHKYENIYTNIEIL